MKRAALLALALLSLPTHAGLGGSFLSCTLGCGFAIINGDGACGDGCPVQWPTDPAPGACPDLPGSPSHIWEARRESFSDGSNPTSLTDYGTIGTTLTQGTAGSRGTYRASGGPGNRPFFSLDGGDFWKSAAEATNLAQPNTFVLVISTNSTGAFTFLDSFDSSPRTRIGTASVNAPWQLQSASTVLAANNTVVGGQWELIVGTTNGASSSLRISGIEMATGDAGSAAYGAGTLGANFSGASGLNGGVALAAIYDTPPDIAALEAAIEDCYGSFPQ